MVIGLPTRTEVDAARPAFPHLLLLLLLLILLLLLLILLYSSYYYYNNSNGNNNNNYYYCAASSAALAQGRLADQWAGPKSPRSERHVFLQGGPLV